MIVAAAAQELSPRNELHRTQPPLTQKKTRRPRGTSAEWQLVLKVNIIREIFWHRYPPKEGIPGWGDPLLGGAPRTRGVKMGLNPRISDLKTSRRFELGSPNYHRPPATCFCAGASDERCSFTYCGIGQHPQYLARGLRCTHRARGASV